VPVAAATGESTVNLASAELGANDVLVLEELAERLTSSNSKEDDDDEQNICRE
jgi:hypothetical protein